MHIKFDITTDTDNRPYTPTRLRKLAARRKAEAAAKRPAQIHHMTRQQRRAAERKANKP